MQDKIITRMGDNARVEFSAEQVKEEILAAFQASGGDDPPAAEHLKPITRK